MKKIITAHADFEGGQVNAGAKRRDDKVEHAAGSRIQQNWRVESTGSIVPRPGRTLLAMLNCPRIEYARIGAIDLLIGFGAGNIVIADLQTQTIIAQNTGYPWKAATVGQVYMTVAGNNLGVCFPGMRPVVVIYTPSTNAWGFATFTFRTVAGQVQEPFYRATHLGATVAYDASSGACTLTFSQPYLTAAMVGSIISIIGQQVRISSVLSALQAAGQVLQRLPDNVSLGVDNVGPFLVGQIVEEKTKGLKMEVTGVDAAGKIVTGILMNEVISSTQFTQGDQLVSPLGTAALLGSPTVLTGGSTVQWQEEFMSDAAGWPRACAYDKGRIIFFDFPQRAEAILWCSVGAYDIAWIDSGAATLNADAGANPSNAILVFIDQAVRVRHVIGWGDEFVFTDKGIFQIPISGQNPLKPGSVEFRQFSNDGVSGIVPLKTQDSIVYVNAGGRHVSTVFATGSYTRPYVSQDMSDFHTDLFTGPVALCLGTGDGAFPERYVYVLNADGTIVNGKFTNDRKFIGWQPWTYANPSSWIFANGAEIYHCVALAGGNSWLERDDPFGLLDEACSISGPPIAFQHGAVGTGPFWHLANQTATVMRGATDLGDVQINGNGDAPQLDPSIAARASGAVIGVSFASVLQSFTPEAKGGESIGQRQHRRKISRAMASFQQAQTGFFLGDREWSPYGMSDDATLAAPAREGSFATRPLGHDYDPTITLIKPRPGPLRIIELSLEVTI